MMTVSNDIALGRVMIVEDEDDIREVLSVALEWVGHEIIAARNRDEAWRQIRRCEPHVILLDLHMPGMSATEFLERVNLLNPKPIVIILTADGGVEQIAEKLGVLNWMLKPFQIDELENLVSGCVAEQRH